MEEGFPQLQDDVLWHMYAQNGLHSSDPAGTALRIWDEMRAKHVTVNARLGTTLLKALLRAESPSFLGLYQDLLSNHPRRGLWTDELLLWADRRRSHLTLSEKQYVVDEVEAYYGVMDEQGKLDTAKPGTGMAEGLRAMLSLMKHDLTVEGAVKRRGGRARNLGELKKWLAFVLLDPTCIS